MADLDVDNMIELDESLVMGGSGDPYMVREIVGWEQGATFDVGSSPRSSDGQAPRAARARDRQVTITFGLRRGGSVAEAVQALRVATSPPTDRTSRRLIRVRTRGVVRRALYMPASQPLTMPGDEADLAHDHVDGTVTLWLPDPVLYSDETTPVAFSVASPAAPSTQTVTNAGSLAAVGAGQPTLGPWSLTLVAGGGGCANPWLGHVQHPGERWVLAESLGSGATITVGPDRVTRRNGTLRTGPVRGPSGCPVAVWPVLRPGAQQLRMGCSSGGFSATLLYRSTW